MSDAIASASNLSAAPEVMIRAEDGLNALFAEALGRNPSLHDPSEYEERSDPGALSNAIREIAIDATGEIPYVGIFVSGLLDLVWPKQEADVQALLKMLYEDAQSIISQRLRIHTEKKYLLKLATIRLALNEYRKGENLDLKAQAFERAFERTRSIVDEMLLQDPEYRSYIAPLTMLAVNTEMTLQKERYLNYEALESVLPIISREACLEDWVRRYDFIRDAVLVGGIDQFPKSLYREYLDGREQKRESRAWGNPDTWMLIWKTGECHGEVKDLETGYEYHGELAATFTENGCFNNPTIFAPTVDNIRARLTLETELNAARTLASVMLMARVLPEGALEAQADRDAADPDRKEEDRVHVRDATELLGKNAYFAPKDMREFDIGPYARPCYVHDGSNRDNYCELGQLTKWEARFDAPIRSIKIGFNDPAIRQIWLEDVNGNAKAAGLETVAHSKQPNPSPPAGQRLIGLGAAQLPLGGSPLQQVVWSIEPIFSRLGPDDQDPKRDNLYFFKSQRLCANERSDDCPLGPTHGDGVLRSPITPTLNGSYDFPVIGVSVYPHSPGALRVRFGFSPNGNQIVRPQ